MNISEFGKVSTGLGRLCKTSALWMFFTSDVLQFADGQLFTLSDSATEAGKGCHTVSSSDTTSSNKEKPKHACKFAHAHIVIGYFAHTGLIIVTRGSQNCKECFGKVGFT